MRLKNKRRYRYLYSEFLELYFYTLSSVLLKGSLKQPILELPQSQQIGCSVKRVIAVCPSPSNPNLLRPLLTEDILLTVCTKHSFANGGQVDLYAITNNKPISLRSDYFSRDSIAEFTILLVLRPILLLHALILELSPKSYSQSTSYLNLKRLILYLDGFSRTAVKGILYLF